MNSRLLISFTTRPGHGSEGGVGWEFLLAALRFCEERAETLHFVYDSRDHAAICHALGSGAVPANLRLHPVSQPRATARLSGDSRTRISYLGWWWNARRVVRRLVSSGGIRTSHQVTFASFLLPSALHRQRATRCIWGPAMLPTSVVPAFGQTRDARISGLRAFAIALAGRVNTRGIDTLVATNQATADLLARFREDVVVEPNILVAQEELPPEVPADERRDVVVAGLLIARKRPWLAIDAMADPRLQGVKLLLVGDGPLRAQLQERAEALGVSDRVCFLGRLSHAETLRVIAQSRILLHSAAREGAAWVVGEAASCGTLALVLGDSGAGSTALLSANGSRVLTPTRDVVQTISDHLVEALALPTPRRSERWRSERLDELLDTWWS